MSDKNSTIHFVITGGTIDSFYDGSKDTAVTNEHSIETSKHKKILVTHGTYTMSDTARFLKANLKRKDQVIILTGSMIPINGFSPSDGPFSLGYAIAQLEHLKPGIYVCVNGRVFSPEEVVKVIGEGRFSSIFER
ncbi:asparaginase [Candidatus Peregrinibacteria bacterium]|nr:asparaginase [Candidatus Peregrinibacteria bacterium]